MRHAVLAWGLAALGLLAMPAFAADTVYYYSSDTLHSEVVITDANRNVVERTYYAPYGEVLNRDLRDGPGYTGHEEDPETDLVYMQQRYYDPETGRFLSTDPVQADGDGGSFNRYEYANDNPYRYTDPTGMCTGTLICNSDGTAVSSGDFTTQASNAHLVGASASERDALLGINNNVGYKTVGGAKNTDKWEIQWKLSQPAAKNGYIVQQIDAADQYKDKDKKIHVGRQPTFWEAWPVAKGHTTVTDIGSYDDCFCFKKQGVSGSVTVTGTARFYEIGRLPYSFQAGNPDTTAGNYLRSTTIDPNLPLGNATAPLIRTDTYSW